MPFLKLYPDIRTQAGGIGPLAPQGVRRAMQRHLPQPEAGVIGGLELAEIPVEFEQHILRQLFSQSPIPRQSPGQRKNHRLVLVHELLEVRLPGLIPQVGVASHTLLLSYPQNSARRDAKPYEKAEEDVSYAWTLLLPEGAGAFMPLNESRERKRL